ncbi:alpha/beta hydrolase fold [Leptothrix cholodnii SP-6]|uniref:Alpha/beta hydrolase fold n=1 Tax=Leptothrix cholodnii (strain ATCC 51168 / LMG 8142 / SP-6) TaxID=395495 RepID=B1XZ15_LEPCP|nr:alpha/beta fold hydrolase [Leptothrix cholodnii]ACB34034.1 alpha/beta hydrolase fold [Leptothrix cholodnii SP-6]
MPVDAQNTPDDTFHDLPPYTPSRPSTSLFVTLRERPAPVAGPEQRADPPYVRRAHRLRYHVQTWGEPALVTPERPALILLHGWMDVGASFQFMVDALTQPRYILALDWRGFGLTEAPPADSYWFPDYLADLDALLDTLLPGQAIDLVGHSMGGNVAMLYAGIRPARIRRLVNLEGFGMPPTRAAMAPTRYERWLDALKSPPQLRSYPTLEAVARRLRLNNPRLQPAHALWLAGHWSRADDSGQYHLLADAAHKRINPVLARQDEAVACWRRISAPVLWAEGAQTRLFDLWAEAYPRDDFETRLAEVQRLRRVLIDDCGHMLHHDQPDALAAHIEAFLMP